MEPFLPGNCTAPTTAKTCMVVLPGGSISLNLKTTPSFIHPAATKTSHNYEQQSQGNWTESNSAFTLRWLSSDNCHKWNCSSETGQRIKNSPFLTAYSGRSIPVSIYPADWDRQLQSAAEGATTLTEVDLDSSAGPYGQRICIERSLIWIDSRLEGGGADSI